MGLPSDPRDTLGVGSTGVEADEKACPYCAETIKAAAIKCKHCGEMLDDAEVEDVLEPAGAPPVWRYTGKMMIWRCIEHDKRICMECSTIARNPSRRAEPGAVYPEPLIAEDQVSLACPKCHTLTTVAASSTSDECSWCGLLLEGETRVLSSAVPRKMPPVSTRGDASYRGDGTAKDAQCSR